MFCALAPSATAQYTIGQRVWTPPAFGNYFSTQLGGTNLPPAPIFWLLVRGTFARMVIPGISNTSRLPQYNCPFFPTEHHETYIELNISRKPDRELRRTGTGNICV